MADPLNITDDDRDMIARVVATEADHRYHSSDPDTYNQMVAGIVDTVLNRVSSPQFPNSVSGVANQKNQFSAINGPTGRGYTVYGDVRSVPNSVVKSYTREAVDDYIDARIMGQPSSIGGGLHYANPFFSDANNLGWVEALTGPRIGTGNSLHYHGTVSGYTPVEASVTGVVKKADNYFTDGSYLGIGTSSGKRMGLAPPVSFKDSFYQSTISKTIGGLPLVVRSDTKTVYQPLPAPAPLKFPPVLPKIVPLPRARPANAPAAPGTIASTVQGVNSVYEIVRKTQEALKPGNSPSFQDVYDARIFGIKSTNADLGKMPAFSEVVALGGKGNQKVNTVYVRPDGTSHPAVTRDGETTKGAPIKGPPQSNKALVTDLDNGKMPGFGEMATLRKRPVYDDVGTMPGFGDMDALKAPKAAQAAPQPRSRPTYSAPASPAPMPAIGVTGQGYLYAQTDNGWTRVGKVVNGSIQDDRIRAGLGVVGAAAPKPRVGPPSTGLKPNGSSQVGNYNTDSGWYSANNGFNNTGSSSGGGLMDSN